ncbi:MAG: alpha/beta fold hydrolase [Bacteroidota bacterium]
MPVLEASYRPIWPMRFGHINTIFTAKGRKVDGPTYRRERVETPDDDFLDLDWCYEGRDQLVIVLHGLEGSADRAYVRGMMKHLGQNGWTGLGLNFRSCSGEMNRQLRVYHSGETNDLRWLLEQVHQRKQWKRIALVGFSLGGNVVLKYLGEQGKNLIPELVAAAAISVPCDLVDSSKELNDRKANWVYLFRFMRSLNAKLKVKLAQFPGQIQLPEGRMPRNFTEFDDCYTAPFHGYESAMDYWTRASSVPTLDRIAIPTLLLNAKDDSFLSESCYPIEVAKSHSLFHLEMPEHGGHCGYWNGETTYAEQRAMEFIQQICRESREHLSKGPA